MKQSWQWVAALCTVVGLVSIAAGTIIHVPLEYPTIQAGIDAAVEGDTVLVADGTYTGPGNRFLDFCGKAIMVTTQNGPEFTTIDCEGSGPGFHFHSGEGHYSVVFGFTITHGYHYGGGIYCEGNSSPTIAGNALIDNGAPSGGGIRCESSNPIIIGNRIVGNEGGGGGGGISCALSSPLITGNTIAGNWSAEFGGGIECSDNSQPHIMDNRIEGNMAVYGGGICCYPESDPLIERNTLVSNSATYGGAIGVYGSSSPMIRGNAISLNSASAGGAIDVASYSTPIMVANRFTGNHAGAGGGVCCWHASPEIFGNTFAANIADGQGGAIYGYYQGSPILSGNTIVSNEAGGSGGGIFTEYHCSPEIVNCTISRNEAGGRGGGICVGHGSTTTVINSIIWQNRADDLGPQIYNAHTLYVDFSCVEGGWSGYGNIMSYPRFVVGEGLDYRLLWGSPCIDAGSLSSTPDPDGTRSDMGAHYFNQDDSLTLYLTPSAREAAPGTQVGVLYTLINRWDEPAEFWGASGVVTPQGDSLLLMGPEHLTLPGHYTARIPVIHTVPSAALPGEYGYGAAIGASPATLFDTDQFTFTVLGPQAPAGEWLADRDKRPDRIRAMSRRHENYRDEALSRIHARPLGDDVVRGVSRRMR